MKQNLLNKLWLRVCMLAAIMTTALAGTAWAEEAVYYVLDGTKTGGTNSYAEESQITQTYEGHSFLWFITGNTMINPWRIGGKNLNGIDRSVVTYSSFGADITKVVVTNGTATATVNSMKLIVAEDDGFNNLISTVTGSWEASGTTTFERPAGADWTDKYFKLVYNVTAGSSNQYAQLVKMEFYYNTGGSQAPSISASNLSIAYDATEGEIEYTISNPVTGGTVSASSSSEWLMVGDDDEGIIPFTCDPNDGIERTATVTLTYAYDNDRTTKNVTITQAANPNVGTEETPYTVAQARAAIDAGAGTTGVYATGIVSAIPTAYSASYKNITFNFVDAAGDTDFLQAYRCTGALAEEVQVGDVVVVYGNLTKYNTTYEFAQGCELISLTHPTAAVEAPTFSMDPGTYNGEISVELFCLTEGATIYYTTDGTEPTPNSTVFGAQDEIIIEQTTVIKAIAVKDGEQSLLATAVYHICSADAPYSVAQALESPEGENVYVKGIVSTVTEVSTNYGNATYRISDDGSTDTEMIVYRGLYIDGDPFQTEDQIQVGDEVVVMGNLVVYNGTNQLAQGNQLVSLDRIVPPVFTVRETEINVAADATSAYTYVGIENIDWEVNTPFVQFFDVNADGTATEASQPDWINGAGVTQNGLMLNLMVNNYTEARTAYLKVGVTVDGKNYYSDLITLTQAGYVEPSRYMLVSSDYTPQINNGKRYIIASKKTVDNAEKVVVMGGAQTTSLYRSVVETSYDDIMNELELEAGLGVSEFIICGPDLEGYYTLYDEAAGAYLATREVGHALTTQATVDDNARWKITLSDDYMTPIKISAKINEDRNQGIACTDGGFTVGYASEGNGVYLYEKQQSDELVQPTITVDEPNINIAHDQTHVEFTCNVENPMTGAAFIATTDASWITSIASSQEVEGMILVDCEANSSDVQRQATITVTYGSIDSQVNVTVVQAPYEYLAPVINAEDVTLAYDATEGTIEYSVENPTGDEMSAYTEADWITNIQTPSSAAIVTFSTTANESTEARTATVTLVYGNYTKDVTVTQEGYEAPVADYAELPFTWEGGVKAELLAEAGVTAEGLGSDYAEANAPYRVKLDTTGDYIQVKTNERPGTVTIGVKMVGGANASSITVQESADGENFTDVEELSISGIQNDIVTLETTKSFDEASRYARLYFTKGSNVGVGYISIAKYEEPAPALYVRPDEIAATADGATGTLTITAEGITLTPNDQLYIEFHDADGGPQPAAPDWITTEITTGEAGFVVNYTIAANQGEARSTFFQVVAAEYKLFSNAVTVSQEAYTAPATGDQYELFYGDLVEGDYIIYYDGKAMSNEVANNRLQYAEVTPENDVITTDNEAIVWHIAPSGDYWTIYSPAAKAYAASNGTKNQAQMLVDADDHALWSVEAMATHVAHEFTNKANTAAGVNAILRNNGTYGFACYSSSIGGSLQLYKKVDTTPEPEYQTVTVTEAGYATFVATHDLEIPAGANIQVYTVQAEETAQLLPVEGYIPSYEAVLVKAGAGEYNFPYTDQQVGPFKVNDLRFDRSDITASGQQYILANGENGVGFYKATPGTTIPAFKAFLYIQNGVKGFYGFDDDDATGINDLKDLKDSKDLIYNLAGQRLQKMQRGINIVGGKKILK